MTKATDFTIARDDLAIGTHHGGFTVIGIEELPELSATGYVMRHSATGARLLWIACADTNRSFAIGFKTPPADDTGVFHILEHSVLCGSDRFAVKEPFVSLLKSSMQTFLNALTFPDKTMYPVASTNVADLENLMDVYLDAVLHPAIYHRPRIFEQEGWHLELESLDAPLTYNGVVFNEMKGALSDPDDVLYLGLCRELFPDSPYGFESGGTPRAIPTLSYEQFLNTHARHYSLANSYTILYGDLDIDRELAFIAQRFDGACDRSAAGTPNELTLQKPVVAPLKRIEMATAPENATVGLAYVIGTAAERERVLASDILLDAIAGSNEAPLKRAVLEAGLGDDFSANLLDGMLQPQLLLQLKGAHEGVAEQFQDLVVKTCSRLAHDGIDRGRLAASLAQAEFILREGDWGSYADGVALSVQAMKSWLYDDDHPCDYLRYEDALSSMKAGLATGYFEDLLRSLICESTHSAVVDLVPVLEGDAAEENAELADRKAAMTTDELTHVMEEVAALRTEQETPDAPEAIATLPRLTIADVGEPTPESALLMPEAPLPCWAHELDTHRISYVYHYFDLSRVRFDELPYVGLLTALFGKLGTQSHSAATLDTLVESKLGNLDFFVGTHGHDDDLAYALPKMVVSASALAENIDSLASLPCEVWGTTRFDDLERIHAIVQQRRIVMEQRFTGSGHAAAIGRLSSYFSAHAAVTDMVGGIGYYLFLKDLLANWETIAPTLTATLSELASRIFTADDVIVSFTGSAFERNAFWEAGGTLGLSVNPSAATKRLVIATPSIKNEAFIIPSDVCYCAEGQLPHAADKGSNGTWQVLGRALSYDYLWNEVRVKGGAYGAGFRHATNGISQFWSYRDPAIDATIQRFEDAGAWLASWSDQDDELEGYIVSCTAAHDTPLKPRHLARRQDSLLLSGRAQDWRDKQRAEILNTSADDIRSLAPALSELSCERALCVFGNRERIAESKLELNVVELMGESDSLA